jgi:hypothetical protein
LKYFLFQHKTELWIVKDPNVVPKPRELILQTSNIELIRDTASKQQRITKTVDKVARKRNTWHTPEGREKIAEAKMGSKNPNAKGLSFEHRGKISRTMKGTRRGENNPMHNRRHSYESRRKMSMMQSLRHRKWCVEPNGKTHLVDPRTFILPGGWKWGRTYDPYKN